MPPPVPPGRDGCIPTTEAETAYRIGQLRFGQAAELFRLFALVCAVEAVRVFPGPPLRPRALRRRLLSIAPLALLGLYSLVAEPGLLPAVLTGVLALAAAVVLAGWAIARAGARHGLLLAGAVVTALPAMLAVETLADLRRQVPDPQPAGMITDCAYAYRMGDLPPASTAVTAIIVAGLFLAGPALLVWSAMRADDEPAVSPGWGSGGPGP